MICTFVSGFEGNILNTCNILIIPDDSPLLDNILEPADLIFETDIPIPPHF
jgi:hypothetical protein